MHKQAKAIIYDIQNISTICSVDGLFPNGSVSVFNAERVKTPDGKAKTIYGYAYRADPKEEGKLTVKLQGTAFKAPCE